MTTDTEVKVAPQGAVDVITCSNGELYVSGWLFWAEDEPRDQHIAIRSQHFDKSDEATRLPLKVVARPRPEVNEYLGIGPDLLCGFSGRTHMNEFSMDTLKAGPADILAVDPKGNLPEMKIGQIDIRWPEPPFCVSDAGNIASSETSDRLGLPDTAIVKPQGLFDRLWNGRAEYERKVRATLGLDEDGVSAHSMIRFLNTKLNDQVNPSLLSDSARLAARIKDASDKKGLVLIFDHDYGGGANTFSRNLMTRHLKSGNAVIRVWYTVSDGTYNAQFSVTDETIAIKVDSGNDLFRLLSSVPSQVIQVNSIWTYPELGRFLDNLLRLRVYGLAERLEFFAHDHMPVCPSLFLINHKGRFCGVPEDLNTCKTCLKRNMQDFKAYYPTTDITGWRKSWQSLLKNADLIRFFSNSTFRNYCDAYPWLKDNPNAIIQGHEVKNVWSKPYSRIAALAKKEVGEGLKIGVFGFISEHKGSHVLKSLSDAIVKKKDDTRINIFGSYEGQTHGRVGAIDIMGPYALVDLVDICEDNGIDVAFVPSICPETFSFITKELSLIGIPVVSFDLGGQADIVKAYKNGQIVKMGTGLSLLRQFKAIEASLNDGESNL